MKNKKFKHRCRKIIAGIFALSVILLYMSGNCFAADFVGIKMFPENVGVFTSDGKQQFIAFGVLATGSTVNITDQVDWVSSNNSIVTIDEKGLATIVSGKTSGQVKITCSYPKTPNSMTGPNLLLLR